ncbi:unnamed protein product, partial [Symbiodinium necroappetens]
VSSWIGPLFLPAPALLFRSFSALAGGAEPVVGPSKEVSVELAEEEEDGTLQSTGVFQSVLLVDFTEEVCAYVGRYDPVTSPVEAVHFQTGAPHLQLHFPSVLQAARAWVLEEEGERLAFYSANEGGDHAPEALQEDAAPKRRAAAPRPKRHTNAQLADQISSLVGMLPALTQQVQDLASRQRALEAKAAQVPSAAPPSASPALPAHRRPFPSLVQAPFLRAPPPAFPPEQAEEELDQAESSDGGMGASGVIGLGSRGAAKREKLQEQLALRTGGFLLAVSQQALRRLVPSEPLPATRDELALRRSVFTSYAERFGGFGSQRGLGVIFWLLANILDAMISGDATGAEEMAALAIIAVEQASQDSGSWDLAYLLTLMEDPPHQLFQHRPQSQNPRLRAFGGLTPQPWATTTLSFVKEIDAIQSRRNETMSAPKSRTLRLPRSSWAVSRANSYNTKGPPLKPFRARAPLKSQFDWQCPVFPAALTSQRVLLTLFSLCRSRVAFRRVAHVAVMACNFLFAGACPCPLRLLTHRPNKAQAAAIGYVFKLCRACGAVEPFLVASAGRRNLSLATGLAELCEHLTFVGPSSDPYGPQFHGVAPEAADPGKCSFVAPGPSPCTGEGYEITGRGQWDPSPFLAPDPDLQIAFLEPDILLHSASPPADAVPDLSRERPREVGDLALRWSELGLLGLKDSYQDQVSPHDSVRVFNCFKTPECDRMIGDRRSRNFRERALRGPSVSLPCGPVFLSVYLNPRSTTLRIAITDRKDFYHQIAAGPRKASHNSLYPPLREELFLGTAALSELHKRRASSSRRSVLVEPAGEGKVIACFKAVLQGDHLGVEEAPETPPEESQAVRALERATLAYQDAKLLGSTEKDVKGEEKAKVAGAELDASASARQAGLVTAGAPCSKRLSLASISLSLASLPSTTDVLHSCLLGGWVSAFLYRRPLMAVFSHAFALVDAVLHRADPLFEELPLEVFFLWLLHMLETGGVDAVAARFGALCLLEQTGSSLMRRLVTSVSLLTGLLQKAIAKTFSRGLQRKLQAKRTFELEPYGLESLLVNDAASSLSWALTSAWKWDHESHINCLESSAFLRLCYHKARQARPSRFASLIDSNVARCAISKGRSPSKALMKVLRRISAVSLACGLYSALPFCPTRLMPADAPSRDAPLLPPRPGPNLLSSYPIDPLAALPRLRRWAANWARLCLLVVPWIFPSPDDRDARLPSLTYVPPPFDFAITQKNRDKLWESFRAWSEEQGVPDDLFSEASLPDIDSINAVLARYGRMLYKAGRPYNHYSETVNALASKFPRLRRLLQPAWDVAFQWQRLEPHVHHQAMPWQILAAVLAAALCWGWPEVAGIVALSWGGLARIGEIFAAYRRDLVLPADVGEEQENVLLSIREPKTRNTAARHQALKVDQPQLVQTIILAFSNLTKDQRLWPWSPATF